MASITDNIKEGLKYPFNDGNKVFYLGILYAIIGLIGFVANWVFGIGIVQFGRVMEHSNANSVWDLFSYFPSQNIIIPIILGIIALLILILTLGYEFRIINFSIKKRKDLPQFDNFKNMFCSGFKIFIVGILYMIIPVVLFILGFVMLTSSSIPLAIGLIVIFIAVILAIILGFIQVMAVNHVVAKDNLRAALDYNAILASINSVSWGSYIGIILLVSIISLILAIGVEIVFTLIGSFFAIFSFEASLIISLILLIISGLLLQSYLSIFCSRVFGSLYNEGQLDSNLDSN